MVRGRVPTVIRNEGDAVREVIDTPIRGQYDTIVCGGGVAGAAAAAAALGRVPGCC